MVISHVFEITWANDFTCRRFTSKSEEGIVRQTVGRKKNTVTDMVDD